MRRSLLMIAPLLVWSAAACSSNDKSLFDADAGSNTDAEVDPFGNGTDAGFKGGETGTGGGCKSDPGNYDIPGNMCDDDGDGTVDNPPTCDVGLPQGGDALAFAKAIGLCQQAGGGKWGVVSAAYTQGYNRKDAPDAKQHGILAKFGSAVKPRQGGRLGVLSSGEGQELDTCNFLDGQSFKGGCPMTGAGAAPPGYPKPAAGCPVDSTVNDVATVKLTVKVPNNAKGFAFDFDFYSGEWPEYVCTKFNDAFIAYLTSQAFNGGKPDNVSFDAKNNPVSVNNGFFDRCSPANATVGCVGTKPSKAACTSGNGELQGTGFYQPGMQNCGQNDSGGGATGWLTTKAPVQPGETITIEFMVWDTGDQAYDSSVLLDNWAWQPSDVTVGTDRPPN